MRGLLRAAILLLPVSFVAWALWLGWSTWRDLPGSDGARLAGADRHIVYALDDRRATQFVFSSLQRNVRIVTHAELEPIAARHPDQRYRYGVIVEALARGGEVIDRRRLEFATRVLLAPGPNGALAPASAYAEANLIPSAADVMLIELRRPAAVMRIRSAGRQAGVRGVAVRVYERTPKSERQLRTAWSRLSAAERADLARGSSVPAELLSKAERRALLENRWSAVGPKGVEGGQYRARVLYVRDVPATAAVRSDPADPKPSSPLQPGARAGSAWFAGPGAPLVFPVSHVGDSATPFRLSLRLTSGRGVSARYELLDEAGAVLAAGPLAHCHVLSGDRLGGTPLAGPCIFWFNLATNVRAIRIVASAPLVVSAANRPPDLAPIVFVPERQVEANAGPSWFAVKPATGPKPVAIVLGPKRSALVDPPEAARGWRRLEPEGRPLMRDIYVPVGTDPDPESVFTPIASGRRTLSFVAPLASAAVAPRLLYLRDRTGLVVLVGTIDGEAWFSERVASISGTLPLDPTTRGPHTVTIAPASTVSLYLTHLPSGPDSLRERRFVHLRPGATRFVVDKTSSGTELVALHVLLPPGGRRDLGVAIGGPPTGTGPHSGWTPRRRRFSVMPGAADRRIHAIGEARSLGLEQRLLLPLRADLPPGRYPITITLGPGPSGYSFLSHRTPGATDRRDVVLEEELDFEGG